MSEEVNTTDTAQVADAPVPEAAPPVVETPAPESATAAPGLDPDANTGDEPFTPTRDEFETVLRSLEAAHKIIEEHKGLIDALRRELHGITR
jgi:hypothetical protein